MHTFTALFNRQGEAEAIQERLEALGIIDLDHGLHSRETAAFDSEGSASGVWGQGRTATPPVEDRRLYEEAVRRGGFLLTVNVDDAQASKVRDILEASPAVDVSDQATAVDQATPMPQTAAPAAGEDVIAVVEEQIQVGRREVDRGGVRIRSYVVETPVQTEVSLREERVDVTRKPVNAAIANAESLFQPQEIELTETAEEVVIAKEALVVEEIALRKDAGERVETVHDTVRHTEVEVGPMAPRTDQR